VAQAPHFVSTSQLASATLRAPLSRTPSRRRLAGRDAAVSLTAAYRTDDDPHGRL